MIKRALRSNFALFILGKDFVFAVLMLSDCLLPFK